MRSLTPTAEHPCIVHTGDAYPVGSDSPKVAKVNTPEQRKGGCHLDGLYMTLCYPFPMAIGRALLSIVLLSVPAVQATQPDPAPTVERYVRNLLGEPVDRAHWHPAFSTRCRRLGQLDTTETDRWADLQVLLSDSHPAVQVLLKEAANTDLLLCLEDRADGARGYFDPHHHLLAVRESLPVAQQAAILVHELRHFDQARRGFMLSLDYDFDEMIRLTFALEADVQAFSTLIAWQLRRRGDDTLWQALHDFKHYRDIATAFEVAITVSGNHKDALTAAFRQWYRSAWRVNVYFLNAGMTYLDMLDETKRIQRYDTLPDDYFASLCVLPDGDRYPCERTGEITRSPRELKDSLNDATSTLYSQWTIPAF